MGLSHTKDYYAPNILHPYHPTRVEPGEARYHPQSKQFIAGNDGLFEFDTKTYKVTKLTVNLKYSVLTSQLPDSIPAPQKSNGEESSGTIPVKIGDKCACFMYANMTEFVVCGGNDDFKEFYDYCYRFSTKYPTHPFAMPNLPIKM
jgi:hypothetical protein